jgi:1-acyl-sn-glycerol-3-phosphate acyltransferase
VSVKPTPWPLWNRCLYALGRLLYRVSGWRVEGQLPDLPKFVAIIAPHTSYWDLPVALAGEAIVTFGFYDVRQMWLGKHSAFRGPLGALLRRTGGVPVDRGAAHGTVGQAIEALRTHERLMLGITPEGTRFKTPHWNSGFYHIALGAQVPIVCVFLDYRRKVAGIGTILWPGGDIQADMRVIREFY